MPAYIANKNVLHCHKQGLILFNFVILLVVASILKERNLIFIIQILLSHKTTRQTFYV